MCYEVSFFWGEGANHTSGLVADFERLLEVMGF